MSGLFCDAEPPCCLKSAMTRIKKFALTAALCLLTLGVIAILGWKFIQHRIALNERAPHLVRINQPADDFPFRTLDGNVQRLSETKGKVVFVDLWGTWCIQCVAEMPTVQELYNHYRNDPDIVFLVISRLDSPATVRRYAHLHHYDLPFYTMNDDSIPASMSLNQFPATFLYAPDGSLAAKHTGAANWSDQRVIDFIDGLKNLPKN
jgi:thiol-disulfide isomerase/thioredoxin